MHIKYYVLLHFVILTNIVNSDSKSIKKRNADLEEVAKYLYPLKMPEYDPGPNIFRNLDSGNAWEQGDEFEGDILLENRDETRAGSFYENWPLGYIPFNWASKQWDDLSSDQQMPFMYALNDFLHKTCVRFAYCGERCSTSSNELGKWVGIITEDGSEDICASNIGMQDSLGQQDLYLGANCFYMQTIIHELVHVLGFWHEQSRGDRDSYVEILEENIQPDKLHNFEKYKTDSRTIYDVFSVMHYSRKAFSQNGLDTINYKSDSSFNQWFGYGDGTGGMSKRDEVAINIRYDCCDKGYHCTVG